jgi:glycerate 2-kinase
LKKDVTILIAPNSYKECADSSDAAALFIKYLTTDKLKCIPAPLSDGGDGFLKVCTDRFGLEIHKLTISSPVNTRIEVSAGYDRSNKILYIESASVIGLNLIPPEKRNPMFLNSASMGELLKKVNERGLPLEKLVIGIGGTGVSDLGIGMLSELGLKLYNSSGENVNPVPAEFHNIADAEWDRTFDFNVEIISDVDNPLTGENGAVYIYGPQKGLNKKDVKSLDNEFSRLVQLFADKGIIKQQKDLSGAGGGIAAAFQMFFNAEVKSSAEFILKDLNLKKLLEDTDYIITGEGNFDHQSLSGKGTGIIIKNTTKPVFLVCGNIDESLELPANVKRIELQKYFKNREESIIKFEEGINKASGEIKELAVQF